MVNDNLSFTHLHVHTEYSTLDGINRLDSMPAWIKNNGMSAVAMTDHGTLGGVWKFIKKCRAGDIKPIVGLEAYIALDKDLKAKDEWGRSYYHLILLAANNTGLKNLIKLSSKAYTDGFYYKPRIDKRTLLDHSAGILVTTACLGSLFSQMILRGNHQAAEKLLAEYKEAFGSRFFIELQPHFSSEQAVVNEILIQLSDKLHIPLIVTMDAHYTACEDKWLHELTLCIQTKSKLSDPPMGSEEDSGGRKRFSFGDLEVLLASPEWMRQKCIETNIPLIAMSNTMTIAKKIDSDSYFHDIHNTFPKHPFPNVYDYILNRCKCFLQEKYPSGVPIHYKKRIKDEMLQLKRLDYLDYLAILADIVNEAESVDIMIGAGRGSAAGSLVAYCLGITKVDPIKHGLLFERFAHDGRGATPIIFDIETLKKLKELEIA